MEAIIAAVGTAGVVFAYVIIKKIARSKCVVEKCSGCLSCESPAVELAKKQTERIEELYTIISRLKPGPVSLEHPALNHHEVDNLPTIGEKQACDTPAAC